VSNCCYDFKSVSLSYDFASSQWAERLCLGRLACQHSHWGWPRSSWHQNRPPLCTQRVKWTDVTFSNWASWIQQSTATVNTQPASAGSSWSVTQSFVKPECFAEQASSIHRQSSQFAFRIFKSIRSIGRPDINRVDGDRQQSVNGAITDIGPFHTVWYSYHTTLKISVGSNVFQLFCYWACCKRHWDDGWAKSKTFCSFIISKLKSEIWCVNKSNSQRHRYWELDTGAPNKRSVHSKLRMRLHKGSYVIKPTWQTVTVPTFVFSHNLQLLLSYLDKFM
jgi:hypothetical protein